MLSSADTHGIAKYARTYIRDAHKHTHTHTHTKSRKNQKKEEGGSGKKEFPPKNGVTLKLPSEVAQCL